MRAYLCCTKCKGKMPAFRCRNGECKCHARQMKLPDNGRPLYRDKTADTAIGRLPERLRG